jgi:hypothetical protein
MTIIFILLFISGFIYYILTYQKPDFKIEKQFIENPNLEKIDLQIKEGEKYIYSINSLEKFNATYEILKQEECLFIKESYLDKENIICLDEKGLYPNKLGSNFIYEYPIYIIKPWMLAVKDNWTWGILYILNIKDGTQINEFKEQSFINFKTVDTEKVLGRDTYKVEVSTNNTKEFYWIDKEKRILIKKEGFENIILVEAPFLNSNNN